MNTDVRSNSPGARHLTMLAACLISLLVLWPVVRSAVALSLRDDRYIQILFAPVMCMVLVFTQRRSIFSRARFSPRIGIPALALPLFAGIVLAYRNTGGETSLSLTMFCLVLAWVAAFVLGYGTRSASAALYPLCCLVLTVPFPSSWIDRIVIALQHGSAAVSYVLLRLAGVPVFRSGLQFSLPGFDFEVAPECSGIRSSLALLMVAVIVAYICLRSGWTRLTLLLLTVPIAIFKNAVRIVAISMLGAYVDRVYADGPFHHLYGGLVFSVVGICVFALVLVGLQKIDRLLHAPPSERADSAASVLMAAQ